jgi:hypothetical protein
MPKRLAVKGTVYFEDSDFNKEIDHICKVIRKPNNAK